MTTNQTDLRTALDPSADGCAPRQVRPSSEDVHAWISRAYRDPEDCTKMDAARFTRWNMEVAFQAGFGAGYRAGELTPAQAPDKAAEQEGVDKKRLIDAIDSAIDSLRFYHADGIADALDVAADNYLNAALAPKPTGTEAGRGVGADGPFPVGTPVEKQGGEYLFPGTVVASFLKIGGQRRYVVEDDRRSLHIFSAANLRERAATPTPPTPDSTAQGDETSQEGEDAYIARVLAMSSFELAAEAEAVGVEAPKPRSLPASLRNLRLRLESALANRLEEGDREAIAWLNEGVIAIGAVLASLPVPADREGGR